MSDLLPCPFCGSTDIDSEPNTDTYGSVCCNKCGFGSPYGEISIMIERWNSRPLEDALRSRIAELEAELAKWKAGNQLLYDTAMKQNHEFGLTMKYASELIEKKQRIAELEKAAVVWHRYPEEKPPESGIEYLVLIDGEIPRLAVYGHHVLCEDDTMNKWYSDEGPAKDPTPYSETEITHWAYLPAPPEFWLALSKNYFDRKRGEK